MMVCSPSASFWFGIAKGVGMVIRVYCWGFHWDFGRASVSSAMWKKKKTQKKKPKPKKGDKYSKKKKLLKLATCSDSFFPPL
jgi:hypothetical protein